MKLTEQELRELPEGTQLIEIGFSTKFTRIRDWWTTATSKYSHGELVNSMAGWQVIQDEPSQHVYLIQALADSAEQSEDNLERVTVDAKLLTALCNAADVDTFAFLPGK